MPHSEPSTLRVEGKDDIHSVGFILDVDAEEDAEDPWPAVCAQLGGVGLTLPAAIPEEGFVGEANMVQARVGVWLMPDNRRAGALEEFLRGLVDTDDSLLPIAERLTHHAKAEGAHFPVSAMSEGRVAYMARVAGETWLALWLSYPRRVLRARQRRSFDVRRVVQARLH